MIKSRALDSISMLFPQYQWEEHSVNDMIKENGYHFSWTVFTLTLRYLWRQYYLMISLVPWFIGYQTSMQRSWIDGVMVSVLASGVVDRGFESRSGHTKDYKIGMYCFSAKHTALRKKSKDSLIRNQDNESGCGDMSIRGLLFQWASTRKIQQSVLF